MTLENWFSLIGWIAVPLGLWYFQIQFNRTDRQAEERRHEREEQLATDRLLVAQKEKENDEVHTDLRKYIERVNNEYYALRLEIAQSYVTAVKHEAMESRFVKAVERIDLKLDRMAEEINRRT